MKKNYALIIISFILISCAKHGPTDEQISNADYGSIPKNPQRTVIEYAKMNLYDYQSAQYEKWSNLEKSWTSNYDMTNYGYKGCVYINSKNRLGGYVGFKQYIYMIRNDKVVFMNGDMRNGSVGEQEIMQACSKIYQNATIVPENNPEIQKNKEYKQIERPLPVKIYE